MKKLFTAICTVCVVASCASNANAQFVAGDVGKATSNHTYLSALLPFTRVTTKAMRDFTKSFPAASAVQWFKTNAGEMGYFTNNGIFSRVSYDTHGNFLYSMRTYDGSSLPKEIRSRIAATYFDYTITKVNEITRLDKTVYLVRMENEHLCTTVCVCDSEDMEVTEAFNK